MCELLGMSFNKAVRPNFSFRGFRQRGEKNPHGWGLAYYPDESVQIIKEPIKTTASNLYSFIQNYTKIQSKIFIGHVRYASVGLVSYKNTHPFQRELNGKDFSFAHNGTLSNHCNHFKDLTHGRFKPVGETDSEYAFCYILNSIKEEKVDQWNEEKFNWLFMLLKNINEYGNFNCIFSDGEHLFCYHDKNGYNGLSYVKRQSPFGPVRLEDEDFEINLSEEKDPSQKGYVIATRPLTKEKWQNFKYGELMIFKDGEIVFSAI